VDQEEIQAYLLDHQRVIQKVTEACAAEIAAAVEVLVETLRQGNKVLIMGNGGSAADAQHFAAELVGRFLLNRQALPAIALTTDTSLLTAVGNDFGFAQIFTRQIEGLATAGDLVVGISTSGNSENVLLGLQAAKMKGCRSIALLGGDGGRIRPEVDIPLVIPTDRTPHVQEAHITLIHLFCLLLEERLVGEVG